MDGCGSCLLAEQDRRTEKAILGLLLDFEAGSLWSVEEMVTQLSAPRPEVVDCLARLRAAGLIHCVENFVFATRAASTFGRLEL